MAYVNQHGVRFNTGDGRYRCIKFGKWPWMVTRAHVPEKYLEYVTQEDSAMLMDMQYNDRYADLLEELIKKWDNNSDFTLHEAIGGGYWILGCCKEPIARVDDRYGEVVTCADVRKLREAYKSGTLEIVMEELENEWESRLR